MKLNHVIFLSFAFGSLFLLTGCSSEERADQNLRLGWVGPTKTALDNQKRRKDLYCYETLGSIECYPQRQPGKDHLLIEDPASWAEENEGCVANPYNTPTKGGDSPGGGIAILGHENCP